jgi:hypothetical protein
MSLNRVHTAEITLDGQRVWVGVYADGSAYIIVNEVHRTIDPDSDNLKIEMTTLQRIWVETEIKKGRAK